MTISSGAICRNRYLFLLCFILLFLLIYYYKESHKKIILKIYQPFNNNTSKRGTICLEPLKNELIKCLLKNLKNPQSVWTTLAFAVNKCSYVLRKTLKTIKLKNKDDEKFVILPEDGSKKGCTVLTIGIGNDIEAEKSLLQLNPKCKFYGVDPIYESGVVYKKIGKFFQTAVSDRSGTLESNVLVGDTYRKKNVESTDFVRILNLTNSDVVDYFFLDAEGAEYSIIPLLNRKILRNKYICQISIELHGMDPSRYNITEQSFSNVITNFIKNTNYLPVYCTNYGFLRTFWVDFQSPNCISKYFSNYCVKNQDWFQIEHVVKV